MHRQGKLFAIWLAPLVIALTAGSVGWLAFDRREREAQPAPDVRLAVQALASQSAELAWLAGEASAGRLTRTFLHRHARDLEAKIRDSLEALRASDQAPAREASALGMTVEKGMRPLLEDADIGEAARHAKAALDAPRAALRRLAHAIERQSHR
jgi:hypothetical protein